MMSYRLIILFLLLSGPVLQAQTNDIPLVQRRWLEISTAHFHVYSCGDTREVYKLSARLEQFCKTYSLLAGSQAVASPPTVVMAFPDHETMKPFLPLYDGKPGNLSGFFTRGSDENLIVLSLPETNSPQQGMQVIFHEYAHLLFRHNDRIWPLWLKEGMAEIYSTFETTGYRAEIARPIDYHLALLAHHQLMPLHELFGVTHDSPQYNESSRQGIFYAESWLLTHYLIAGDNPVYKVRFERFNELLRAGEPGEQAFTNAMGTSLPVMEAQLREYLKRGKFSPITLSLASSVSSPVYVTTQFVTPVETYFRLGDELLRIGRPDAAENYFRLSQKLAPASPLPYEGLGLVAAERGQHAEAIRELEESLKRSSSDFLTYYVYAKETYQQTADGQGRYSRLPEKQAEEIRGELQKSLALMPDFAGAHELFGFFEMVQGNLPTAKQQLEQAIRLEPENSSYLLSLAQVEILDKNPAAARQTLEPLLLPNADAKLRASAEELLQKIGTKNARD